MKQIFSPRLEATAIRSIASADPRIAGWLFPRVSAESFSWGPCTDFYRRLAFLTNKDGEIPRWDDLLEDLAIAEDSRDELARGGHAQIITTRREAKLILDSLEKYRRARALMTMAKHIARTIKSEDKIDIEALTDEAGDMLSRARGHANMEDAIFSFGGPRMDKRAILEVLNAPRDEFIPTGFRAFNSINQGVPRGSLWMMAGQTGAGKSVMANCVALHQARYGEKVALISLEMNRRQCTRRLLSNLTAIPLQIINKVWDADTATKRMLIEAYKDYDAQVRRNGGRFTLFTPDEDVGIDDILTYLKPRGYDNIIIDYMGLLKGMDGDDQWRKLGAAARMGKRYTAGDQSIVTLLAQLSEEGLLRYSRTMQEHASLMWTFTRTQQEREAGIITVKQPKNRESSAFDFHLKTDYHIMRLTDVDVDQISGGGKKQVSGAKKPQRVSGPKANSPITLSNEAPEHGEYQL